ncbi:hypothetical protein SAMN05216371_8284 [Streptomyces sp. TLI_053]|uniref:hypothetical protein n=1 Tax=Streptomyces sp. TLI_053 TaxID=1855352 RepID=UPI00087C9900|nr:hypothetical protein [Streptomyces sp. TLI_053]SDT83453.1 hypothetical protein SAMN05216371_8284 [Streptomyces sp. TLI_053]
MPKHQSRSAHLARRIQATTGVSYTAALGLVTPNERWLALSRALREHGMTDAADSLHRIVRVDAQQHAWWEAYALVEHAHRELRTLDRATFTGVSRACKREAHAVAVAAGFLPAGHQMGAEVYHAAFLALSQAGTLADGRALARAAVGALDDDPLECSDVVRSAGRRPVVYRTAQDSCGPDSEYAFAAGNAARAMAAASRVPWRGDEQWYEAAALMAEAAWYGTVAAGRPPLRGRERFREFLDDDFAGRAGETRF